MNHILTATPYLQHTQGELWSSRAGGTKTLLCCKHPKISSIYSHFIEHITVQSQKGFPFGVCNCVGIIKHVHFRS